MGDLPNAATEVYLDNGAEPPNWQDTSLPDEKPGAGPPKAVDASGKEIKSFYRIAEVPESKRRSLGSLLQGMQPQFSPNGIFNNKGGFGETRLNKTTYDFIRDECLFSVEGRQRYAKAVVDGKKSPISFPVESIEVKAAWLDFEKEKIPHVGHASTGLFVLDVYTQSNEGDHEGTARLIGNAFEIAIRSISLTAVKEEGLPSEVSEALTTLCHSRLDLRLLLQPREFGLGTL